MTRDEFHAAAAILDGGWPGEFTDAEEDAYYFLLEDFALADVLRALKALRRSRFRPAASEIVNALTGGTSSAPTFDEMLVLLESVLYVHVRGTFASEAERDAATATEKQRRLTAMHPLAAHFIDRHGSRFRDMPLYDDEGGQWRRKELREAWEAHCEAMKDRELAALASGRRSDGLARLDPLAALGLNHPALPSGG